MLRRAGPLSLRTILLHLTMRGLPARQSSTDQSVVQGTAGQDGPVASGSYGAQGTAHRPGSRQRKGEEPMNPDLRYAHRPFIPPLHADGTRAWGRYVVFEGSLHTVRVWEAYQVAQLEVYAHQHPGEGWKVHEVGNEPPGWGYYLKEVPTEDLIEGQVRISTHGMWRGNRMCVAGFDGDGNIKLRGQVGYDLYKRALNGEEPGVISVDGTDAYWHLDVTVVREDVTDITYTYDDFSRVGRGDLR